MAFLHHPKLITHLSVHCKEITIYVFLDEELRGLSPNFHIHVSIYAIYKFPRSVNLFCLQQNRQPIVGIHKSFTETLMYELGLSTCSSFSKNICFAFLVLCLCSVHSKSYLNKSTETKFFSYFWIWREKNPIFPSELSCFRQNLDVWGCFVYCLRRLMPDAQDSL
jgi:hypothetical protein